MSRGILQGGRTLHIENDMCFLIFQNILKDFGLMYVKAVDFIESGSVFRSLFSSSHFRSFLEEFGLSDGSTKGGLNTFH